MAYVMELQSEHGLWLTTEYPKTLKDVENIAKQWKPDKKRLVWNVQKPSKKYMLENGGQQIAMFRDYETKTMLYIYVTCDCDTVERYIQKQQGENK